MNDLQTSFEVVRGRVGARMARSCSVLLGLALLSAPALSEETTSFALSFDINKDLWEASDWAEPPQLALWLESPTTGAIRTLFVTYRTATDEWEGKSSCPPSLPYWVSRYREEFGRDRGPTRQDPLPDAVTGATPRLSFSHAFEVGEGDWNLYLEVNVSGDYNQHYRKVFTGTRFEDFGNGQPSLVYRAHDITGGDGVEVELIGMTTPARTPQERLVEPIHITSADRLIRRITLKRRPLERISSYRTGLYAVGAAESGEVVAHFDYEPEGKEVAESGDGGWQSLFDGKTLAGWHVAARPPDQGRGFWTVRDGAITADSLGKKDHDYVWLVSDAEFGDFELELEVRGFSHSPGNSGVQFRSRYDDARGWLHGPQVDVHPPAPWRTGLIYDETREARRWIFPSLEDWRIEPSQGPTEWRWHTTDEGDGWNTIRITGRGTRIETTVNGIVIADYDGAGVLDDEAHRRHDVGLKGHFALQLHSGDELLIQYRNIRIRRLD